jgi:hypothetical protein
MQTQYKHNANIVITLIAQITFLTSCVKEPPHNTGHPDYGKITLTPVWNDRAADVPIPAEHSVRTKHASSEHSHAVTRAADVNTLDELFPAGEHRIQIYNAANNIAISGTVATAAYKTPPLGGYLGWLFTGAETVTVEKDTDHAFTLAMHQQVRQLTLIVEPVGYITNRIASVEVLLTGVASELNFDNGEHAKPVDVQPLFVKQTDGRYRAIIRLLGIVGNEQTLTLAVAFTANTPPYLTVTKDVSLLLASFNADKNKPLTLSAQMAAIPTIIGDRAVISDWEKIE